MPKATTSRLYFPVKKSSVKVSHRKKISGLVLLPLSPGHSSLPVFPSRSDRFSAPKSQGEVFIIEEKSTRSTEKPPEVLWFAEDIFRSANTASHVPARRESAQNHPASLKTKEEPEDPSLVVDVEETLDELAIESALNAYAADELQANPNDNSNDNSNAPQDTFPSHYLPFLFAAKAPAQLPLSCSNTKCQSQVPTGSRAPSFFRCTQCFGRRIVCGPCLVESHQHLPFHWPEAWIDKACMPKNILESWGSSIPNHYGYFKRVSLCDLGLQVPLGHDGGVCPASRRDDCLVMSILHTTGQHTIRFRPCKCSQKESWVQLLEVDIFPATELNPRTGFTIEVLRHQRCFSLRGKTSLKEYYDALVDLTSAADGKAHIPSLYEQLRIIVRIFRVLTMHMRAGRFDASVPLKPGELCVECPACPQPGLNLPQNWELDPLKQLHYLRFLGGDGNFKLQRLAKRRSVRTESATDTSLLGDGGFWVQDSLSQRYLSETSVAVDEPNGQRKSACNTMAGDPGYTPEGSKALDVTGIFCVSCRHIFVCPNGVVDLHKGEKYRYADVCFAGPLNRSYHQGLRYFVITYDIACKYGINFKSRCCDRTCNFVLIPTGPNDDINIIFCVNKFHQESHDDDCAAKNALDYTKYVGRTCGEGVETIWAKMNWLRYSTREMGAGNRIETLSEHFNDWNWQKKLGIVRHVKSAYMKSVQSLDITMRELEDLKQSIGSREASSLESKYNALGGEQFLQNHQYLQWLSRKDLYRKMTDIDGSSSGSLRDALGLRRIAARLSQRVQDLAKMNNVPAALEGRIAGLTQKVNNGIQAHYDLLFEVVPQLEPLRRTPGPPTGDEILLPSRLTPEEREHYGVLELLETEVQLRGGHAFDCIYELRKALTMQSFWSRHVLSQHSSQKTKTKGRSNLQVSCARVRETSRAYTKCYEWLVKCSPETAEKFGLQPLRRQDMVLLGDWQSNKSYKRPNGRLPWIWTLRPMRSSDIIDPELREDVADTTMPEDSNDPTSLDTIVEAWREEFVRLDFVHAMAATERWTEEVRILTREMAATCRSFRASAQLWARRAGLNSTGEGTENGDSTSKTGWEEASPETRGYMAYASRQFDLYANLTENAITEFVDVVGSESWWDIWSSPAEGHLVGGK
ncbi:hypothetical protein M407DRAFT_31873 [Tulasnella calospora MUT 4182]|uniref:CxC2-like cysteine cluster KDZ transposase-associated domain-containing protein n=1 Tax=Tulasnella calospora MUT 4182 TaxID=1051891 RepID=A0A0C3Q5R1_9AGAM|nr:hypothetical protein M407DRAFT_31873 [Tulasnella calospora MUT 4182]